MQDGSYIDNLDRILTIGSYKSRFGNFFQYQGLLEAGETVKCTYTVYYGQVFYDGLINYNIGYACQRSDTGTTGRGNIEVLNYPISQTPPEIKKGYVEPGFPGATISSGLDNFRVSLLGCEREGDSVVMTLAAINEGSHTYRDFEFYMFQLMSDLDTEFDSLNPWDTNNTLYIDNREITNQAPSFDLPVGKQVVFRIKLSNVSHDTQRLWGRVLVKCFEAEDDDYKETRDLINFEYVPIYE